MSDTIRIIDRSDRIDDLLAPHRGAIGRDFAAYRGHVQRVVTYAMHFLDGDEQHRPMVETALAFHDIGLWTANELAYLEPSEEIALRENAERSLDLDPGILRAAIHWHHKVTPYSGQGAEVVNAVRKGDWIDASGGRVRKGLSRAQVARVEAAIPDHGFAGVLQRLARDLGGNAVAGNLRVLTHVFKP